MSLAVGIQSIACSSVVSIEGEGDGGWEVALGGAGAFDGILAFLDLFWPFFFNSSKKGLDPSGLDSSVMRISKIYTNIHRFPFATGQRGGIRARAHWTRCVWKVGWKSTQKILPLLSF